jgi:multisubunit Na+/H+ antiporter MnhB subunit
VNARGRSGEPGLFLRAALFLLLLVVAAGLGLLLLTEPAWEGLASAVHGSLAQSGADNPVTAVLLNFRGYDTLLEIAVLTVALVGVWALGSAPRIKESTPSPALLGLNSVLIPLVPVVCGYLLWVGSKAPGGAFQAGSVLAAAGVLYILSGRRPQPALPHAPVRWLVVVGLAVFLGVALGVMGTGRRFVEYPPDLAGALILFIETAATLSIAVVLAGLFIGGRPEDEP